MSKVNNKGTAILVIIFWNFTIFQYMPDSPQVKRNVISNVANLVYQLPHDLRFKIFAARGALVLTQGGEKRLKILGKLGRIRKISNLGGHIAQCPVSFQEIRLWQQQLKNMQKHVSHVFPVQDFSISFQYFVWNCRTTYC